MLLTSGRAEVALRFIRPIHSLREEELCDGNRDD